MPNFLAHVQVPGKQTFVSRYSKLSDDPQAENKKPTLQNVTGHGFWKNEKADTYFSLHQKVSETSY